MIAVRLTSDEVTLARREGARRMATAVGKPKWAYKGRSGVDTHTIGCAGEIAFCRLLGVEWMARIGVGHHMPDIDPFWEVRWSGRTEVPVKTNDRDDQLVVMVTGKMPTMQIMGYIRAGGAKRKVAAYDLGNRKRPAHFIHQSHLAPIETGFHSTCSYLRAKLEDVIIPATKHFPERRGRRWLAVETGGEWICAFCGSGVD